MGDVILFQRPDPLASREPVGGYRGCIHVWMHGPREFEIGHESSSGDSWGSFDQFDNAIAAVAAARRLNRYTYGDEAEIYIPDAVRACLPGGAA